jgi:hypothetical protein
VVVPTGVIAGGRSLHPVSRVAGEARGAGGGFAL